ncbi:putative phage protein (TIGR02216 family) [Hasllibacter halocynthiae]|uniref:Putative phage protein (TIGR02216 family) n=1 Tax=Hasllibacter halocynthiae TaxID=595589 RepID=A0A2T0X8V4_9RHOB|nr:rcc01693 family protein [Hasllibacter halocynthiae]PRY95363.1 putative phage protein (TIGR02216 family) [Hasllibacter halocynthiae]
MSGIDWKGLLRAGVRGAGLRPEEVWRLTPAELAVILGAGGGGPGMGRARLEELAAMYPDGGTDGRS